MIYAGFIHFNQSANGINSSEEALIATLSSLIDTNPSVIKREHLTLCYGKVSNDQDMDSVWKNETSLLIGRIFDKYEQRSFSEENFKNYAHLSNEDFLRKIWGKYVYIRINKEKSLVEVVLDLTGQLPFFYFPLPNGSVVFASHIEIISRILSHQLEYNLEYLCSYLVYGNSSSIQTPFKGIYELPPACLLKITINEQVTVPFWDPLHSYTNAPFETIPEKSAVDVLQKTLKPWIKPYENICVSLSGGLDSSSLVYCLKDIIREDQTLKALNYFHSEIKSSNELVHARNVCKDTNIELIEVDVSDSLPFDPSQSTQLLIPNKPFPGLVSQKWLEKISNYIYVDPSTIFVSGHGSDHIFMRPPSKLSIADCFIEKDLKKTKQKLREVAQFYRDPLFSVLKANLISLSSYFLNVRKKKRDNTNDEIPKWINSILLEKTSPYFIHPIYESLPKKTLPGKYEQIDTLYEGLASIQVELLDQENSTYYPFLYEPVVEFALSFPTYELFDKGYDRYPLRKTVSDRFKTETVWRRDKSQTTGLFQLGVKRNLEYVLATCLDGYFVKQGLIDREGLKQTISRIANGGIKHLWPFMHLISTEMFIQSWEKKSL